LKNFDSPHMTQLHWPIPLLVTDFDFPLGPLHIINIKIKIINKQKTIVKINLKENKN